MNTLQRIARADRQRDNIPGEHWAALAGGIGLWLATRKHPSLAVRVLAGLAGGLLAARALSGRDVPPVLERWLPHAD